MQYSLLKKCGKFQVRPSKLAQAVTILTCILEVAVLNLGSDDYPD
jgi:hypothetical protein